MSDNAHTAAFKGRPAIRRARAGTRIARIDSTGRFKLIDALSVAENIALALAYGEVPARERARRIDEAMARLGISHCAGHRPHQRSGRPSRPW